MGAAESTEANPITAFNNLGLVHHRCLRPNCPTRCDRQRCARADHPACRHPPCLDPTRCVWTPYRVVAMPPDARLDQVYVPSGFSDAGESEPDMDPPSQRAVTTDPANEVLNGIYIGVRRGAASCRPSHAACSVLRARSCAACTSAKTHGFSTTRVPARLDGYRTGSCQVSRCREREEGWERGSEQER
jgi:hypothetical protein